MNVSGLLARATRHRHTEFLAADERRVCVCVCVCTSVYIYMCVLYIRESRLPCFFSHYRSPEVSPSMGGMLFLTGGSPRPRFFSFLTSPRICFPCFFFAFFTGAPIIRRSAFASVSYSFSTDRGRPLSPTALTSTLFHLIKGHKLPARLPYDDGEKKRKGKKEDIPSANCSSLFFPVVFLAGGP